MVLDWEDDNVTEFVAVDGTRYQKGPFNFGDNTYDYKLTDKDGEDYCTLAQMKAWGVKLGGVLKTGRIAK